MCVQDAFHRFETGLSTSGAVCVPCYVRAHCFRTLSPGAMKLPSSRNELPRLATPRSLRQASRRVAPDGEKMLLTDFCNRLTTRAPVDRLIPERAAFTVLTDNARHCGPRVDLSTFACSASNHLAATRPQVDVRLTARIELRPRRSQPGLISEPLPNPAFRAGLPLPRRFRPRARLATSTSDAPCHASRPLGYPSAFEEPEPLPPHSRQRLRLSRLRAPSIDRVFSEHPLSRALVR
jgi:hypothetical protein